MTPKSSVEYNIKLNMPSSADTKTTPDAASGNPDSRNDDGFSEFLKVIGTDDASADELLSSVQTADSWGGDHTLPPLQNGPDTTAPTLFPPQACVHDEEDLSDPDEPSEAKQIGDEEDLSNPDEPSEAKQIGGQASAEAPPQEKEKDTALKPALVKSKSIGSNVEDVAQFINFDKYLTKHSANFYYSEKNKSVRDKLEKVKSAKVTRRATLGFDDSMHGRVSLLTERVQSSSYKGPVRLKSDGSAIKPVMKRGSNCSVSVLSLDDDSAGSGMKRNISFASVHIREHERIAGDNPCVTSGVPLSIGWGSVQHPAIDLDVYEKNKGPSRDKIEMMVPATVRKSMLRDEFGVSMKDLNEAMKNVNITKRNRRHTVAGEGMEGWGEGIESAKRKLGRLVKITSKEKEEQKLWEQARKAAMESYSA